MSRGNRTDLAELYRQWRGHAPQIEPMLVNRGLSAEGLFQAENRTGRNAQFFHLKDASASSVEPLVYPLASLDITISMPYILKVAICRICQQEFKMKSNEQGSNKDQSKQSQKNPKDDQSKQKPGKAR